MKYIFFVRFQIGRIQEMATATEVVGFRDLFQKDLTNILQKIFLYLDPHTLHSSRQVCQQWNTFILSSVWGSRSGINSLKRRLHYNWLNKDPEVQVFSDHYIWWPLALKDNCLVVSVSAGARVINLVSKEIVGHLDHPSGVDQAVITETWIITCALHPYPSLVRTAIIWNRKTLEKVQVLSDGYLTGAVEIADRVLCLSLDGRDGNHTLLKISPNRSQKEKILEVKAEESLLVKNDDIPSIITVNRQSERQWRPQIKIDEVHKDEIVTRTIEDDDPDIPLLALSGPHLVSLAGSIMKVWNINMSTLLYSIDMEQMCWSMVIQNNLVKVECLDKIYVFDGTTIEDRKSVIESKREIEIRNSGEVLIDRSMVVVYKNCIGIDTKGFHIKNFWI